MISGQIGGNVKWGRRACFFEFAAKYQTAKKGEFCLWTYLAFLNIYIYIYIH